MGLGKAEISMPIVNAAVREVNICRRQCVAEMEQIPISMIVVGNYFTNFLF